MSPPPQVEALLPIHAAAATTPTRPRRSSVNSHGGSSAERPRRTSIGSSGTPASSAKKELQGPGKNPLYKTSMCANYQSTGACPYHGRCQFAHGQEELELWQAYRNEHLPAKKSGGSKNPDSASTGSTDKPTTDFSLFKIEESDPSPRRSSVPAFSSTPHSASSSSDAGMFERERASTAPENHTYDNVSQLFCPSLISLDVLKEIQHAPI